MRRRRVRGHLAATLAATAVVAAAIPGGAAGPPTASTADCTALRTDAVHARVLGELNGWVRWLKTNRVRGLMGEIGWPDDSRGDGAQWNCLADDYYTALDRAGLGAIAWMATDTPSQTATNALRIYSGVPGAGVMTPNNQAPVLEAHGSTRSYLRGTSIMGPEQGFPNSPPTSAFTNTFPGVYGVTWSYPSPQMFPYLASRGIRLVRIGFRWERLQPNLYQPLDATELGRLQATVAAARAAGLQVMLDMHNFAGYYVGTPAQSARLALGTPQLPTAAFVDAWRRISTAFRSDSGVSYELMNEPAVIPNLPGMRANEVWHRASQAALSAIRANGDHNWVAVDGYGWAGVQLWAKENPKPWIKDPLNRFWYDAHHYWDLDYSARYANTYSQENSTLTTQ